MMRKGIKRGVLAALFAAALIGTGMMSMAEELANETPGVTVEADENSATGYKVFFTYYNDQATNVSLRGSFSFYTENDENIKGYGEALGEDDSFGNHMVNPADWSKDKNLHHIQDEGFITPMEKDEETGAWTYSMELTGGYYLYKYDVSYDDGKNYESITDPENLPYCNSLGASQTRSQFYVPYDAEKQPEYDDWTFASPAEQEEDRGMIVRKTYVNADGTARPLEVYLPAHYDENREEPYKVLYLSHGGGGDEGDWFYQGHAGNIMDRLAAEGECEEFIMAAVDNAAINWELPVMVDELHNYLVPFMEEEFNVSKEAQDRAYAGLSMGGGRTSHLLFNDPTYFGYYGIFSVGGTDFFAPRDDYSDLKVPTIYLGVGFGDWAYREISMYGDDNISSLGIAQLFDEQGITYNGGNGYYIAKGAHDWYTWTEMMHDFLVTTLWK